MVWLSLCCDFPQALALLVCCHLTVYPSLCLFQFSLCCDREIWKALPILLFYSHIIAGVSEASSLCMHLSWSRVKPATGLCPPQLGHIVVCIFCCVTLYLIALHSTLSMNNRLLTLTQIFMFCIIYRMPALCCFANSPKSEDIFNNWTLFCRLISLVSNTSPLN